MPVSAGTRLGPYEVKASLGAGGMGEVYRAVDTRLDRSVAVKILPPEFAQNVQLKLRFEREAKTISQLNHPNICTLYDVGHENGTDYIVMELIDGETLSDRLARGPLPLPELLKVGVQIAEALDKAHKHGVIHRDLKPGNVMLTKSGAKLLDFGLARGAVIEVAADGETMQMQKSLTQEGTIVGTFQYMSPEQLEGAGIDHRSDVFALGTVLYEMATGKRAFEGKTKTSLIAAIVAAQPPPVSQVQPLTPPALEHVIERCLGKDPNDRWQSARDVAEELRWIATSGGQALLPVQPAGRGARPPLLAWTIAAIAWIAAAALGTWILTRPAPRRLVVSINAPEGTRFAFDSAQAVISPDGNSIVFAASAEGARSSLWVRPLSSPAALRLAGTENASFPFWSPDSRFIAFFADGKLKRTEASGGPVETIANAPAGRGGTWGPGDVIVFAPTVNDPLFRVSDGGGEVRPVTKLRSIAETSHRFPSFLPDGKHFVFYVQGSGSRPNVCIGNLEGREPKEIGRADAGVVATSTGELLLVHEGVMRARRLNLRSLELEGDSTTITEGVQTGLGPGFANISASRTGTITYVGGPSATTSRQVWVDRDGKQLDALPYGGDFLDPRLSPDGKRLLFVVGGGNRMNLYLYDIARRVSSRFTFGDGNEWAPAWSPDGQSIAFTSFINSAGDVHVKRADGTGSERKIFGDARRKIVSDWPREDLILYHTLDKSGWNLAMYSFRENRARVYFETPFSEYGARLSPNGKWIVYTSNESGTNEIYVRSFDSAAGSGKWQVSTAGGQMPSWSPDGKEIFYLALDQRIMAANVLEDVATFAVDLPRPLMSAGVRQFTGMTRNQYSTDGKTFVLNVIGSGDNPSVSITVVQNWKAR